MSKLLFAEDHLGLAF